MKRKIISAFLILAFIALIVYAKSQPDNFSLAENFPSGALVYAQTSDLPALVKLWNESNFREKYLASQNYDEFKNRHLGRKIASRWQEFNDATGFPIDLETVAELTTGKAAIAVYDIGKLDFVFIAPISSEVFAATKFVQKSNNYTEQTLEDGTTFYRMTVNADRGRQKQELIFTNVKDHFILTTSEKLLVVTLNNINGKTAKNSLAVLPEFSLLSEKVEPHELTVWVDQTALNDDYYFKRYWLMSDISELKNYRAGMFDFDRSEKGKLIERRKFLLAQSVDTKPLTNLQTNEMLAFLPENIPFYQLEASDAKDINKVLKDTLFERPSKMEKSSSRQYRFADYDLEGRDFSGDEDYSSLGDNFDQHIDEIDEPQTVEKHDSTVDFSALLQASQPQSVLTFTDPKVLPFPLFAEFRRAAVVHLATPQSFDKEVFESKIADALAARVLISAPETKFSWETKNENNLFWRELALPMLGQTIAYTLLNKSDLVVTNNAEFLNEISATNALKRNNLFSSSGSFSELTFINFTQRGKSYDPIFNELQEKPDENNFFVGNIGSLFDSMSGIKTLEIKKNYTSGFLEEELVANYK